MSEKTYYVGTGTDGKKIVHYGVKGMRKGVRRYTNADGSLNAAGERRYNTNLSTGAGNSAANRRESQRRAFDLPTRRSNNSSRLSNTRTAKPRKITSVGTTAEQFRKGSTVPKSSPSTRNDSKKNQPTSNNNANHHPQNSKLISRTKNVKRGVATIETARGKEHIDSTGEHIKKRITKTTLRPEGHFWSNRRDAVYRPEKEGNYKWEGVPWTPAGVSGDADNYSRRNLNLRDIKWKAERNAAKRNRAAQKQNEARKDEKSIKRKAERFWNKIKSGAKKVKDFTSKGSK